MNKQLNILFSQRIEQVENIEFIKEFLNYLLNGKLLHRLVLHLFKEG